MIKSRHCQQIHQVLDCFHRNDPSIKLNRNPLLALLTGPDAPYAQLLNTQNDPVKRSNVDDRHGDKESFLQIHVRKCLTRRSIKLRWIDGNKSEVERYSIDKGGENIRLVLLPSHMNHSWRTLIDRKLAILMRWQFIWKEREPVLIDFSVMGYTRPIDAQATKTLIKKAISSSVQKAWPINQRQKQLSSSDVSDSLLLSNQVQEQYTIAVDVCPIVCVISYVHFICQFSCSITEDESTVRYDRST